MAKYQKIIKSDSTASYKGERVRIFEVIGNTAYIWIPSRQEEVSVNFNKLRSIKPKPKLVRL